MAELKKNLRLDCTASECTFAANNRGIHEVYMATTDPSISVAELMPGTHIQTPTGYKGPENEIIGSLVFECPDSGAVNYRVLVGSTGKMVIGAINELTEVEPELVVG